MPLLIPHPSHGNHAVHVVVWGLSHYPSITGSAASNACAHSVFCTPDLRGDLRQITAPHRSPPARLRAAPRCSALLRAPFCPRDPAAPSVPRLSPARAAGSVGTAAGTVGTAAGTEGGVQRSGCGGEWQGLRGGVKAREIERSELEPVYW